MFRYRVEGMTCSACSAHVEKAVRKLPCVKNVQVNLMSGSMSVETQDGAPHEQEIVQAVVAAGYGAESLEQASKAKPEEKETKDEAKELRSRFWWSLGFLLPLMYISMQHMFGWPLPFFLGAHGYPMVNALAQIVLTTPVLLLNYKFFTIGFKRLLSGSPNMDSLIAVGSGAAYFYGIVTLFRMALAYGNGDPVHTLAMELYFESSAMILTLVTLGRFFEARAKKRTTSAIEKLMQLTPDNVTVVRDGAEQTIPTSEVRLDDVLLIRPGERIPVDGVLLEGEIAVDQSHITGESVPVDKKAGDELVSGSMNNVASFRMRATRVGEDTTLAKIVRLVQEAGDSKAPIAKLADQISGVFVPIVMGIALLTLIVWLIAGQNFSFALSCAIAVLVISCPCALGLATPVAIMVGTGVGAQHGILFRNGEVLETLHHIKSIVLDKTGTLTEGRMAVAAVEPLNGTSIDALLRVAVSLEKSSEHPLARAVVRYGDEKRVAASNVSSFKATAGRGLSALLDGEPCLAGNPAWMEENGVSMANVKADVDQLASQGVSVLCFAQSGRLLGLIGVSDVMKPTAASAVAQLKELGVTPYLLTGDRREAAQHVAAQAGISEVFSEVMPADKSDKVRALQQDGSRVAMVGDGINDAPALKQADVGIAVGSGTDIAIETADVVLAGNRMTDIPTAIRLSRAVIRNIKENLFWAFFYNVIGIPIAAGALYPVFGITLSPMLGAAAMSLSSVCVVSNALRLKRFRAVDSNVQEMPQVQLQAKINPQTVATIKEEPQMTIEKTILVDGMSCNHCKMSVEKALAAVDGVTTATVSLENKCAAVTMSDNVPEDVLKNAITEAGFEYKGIK